MPKLKILYEYDFGDCWRHWIEFENQIPRGEHEKYPILVDGARHCPPEDIGGPPGYEQFLAAWRDPKRDVRQTMRRWAGRTFEPETFDREKTQKAINGALRKCRKGYHSA